MKVYSFGTKIADHLSAIFSSLIEEHQIICKQDAHSKTLTPEKSNIIPNGATVVPILSPCGNWTAKLQKIIDMTKF